jgi:Zn-dependent peptidase ImmA (M78 family)
MHNKYLNLMYRTLNVLLFKSRLPDIPVLKKKISSSFAGYYIYKDSKPVAIVIGSWVPIEDSLQVLVHEMVHAYTHLVLKDRSKLEHSPSFVKVLSRVYSRLGFPRPSQDEISNATTGEA